LPLDPNGKAVAGKYLTPFMERNMEDLKEKKQELRKKIDKKISDLSRKELKQKYQAIEDQLFEFANFLEAQTALLYISQPNEVDTRPILKRCGQDLKQVVLPLFHPDNNGARFYKLYNIESDLKTGPGNIVGSDPDRCKLVNMDAIDIAIIPGIAFDEKGGRLGDGTGRYDRIIPKLPATTRKVAFAIEDQMVAQVPMDSHDKYVDIIITDKRIIYKI
jgi:5-formyltetrahydrofolate cyclo-ligase